MNSLDDFACAVVLLSGMVAGVSDLCFMRISNKFVFALLLCGLAYQSVVHGEMGTSLLGILFGGGVLLPFYALGGMGAGDVKFAAAIGAWWAPSLMLEVLLNASLLAGLWSLSVIVLRKLSSSQAFFASAADLEVDTLHDAVSGSLHSAARYAAIPFAVALAIATDVVAIGWRWQG